MDYGMPGFPVPQGGTLPEYRTLKSLRIQVVGQLLADKSLMDKSLGALTLGFVV